MTAAEPTLSNIGAALPARDAKPLRIALLGYRSHPFVGGQGIYLKYLSRALAAQGHSVDVFSGPPYPELDDNIQLIKIPSLNLFEAPNHVRALRWHHLKSYSDTIEWFSMLTGGFAEPYTFGRRLVKYLRRNHSHYDIFHDNQSLCYGLLQIQRMGCPVVSTIHHPIHRDLELTLAAAKNWKYRLFARRWYSFLRMQEQVTRQLKHVVTVSQASQNDIATHFNLSSSRTTVIPNGIDTAVFRPLPEIAPQPYRLITTASSDQPLKGLSFLLQAVAKLRRHYPELHLRVIGKLKEDGATQQLLTDLRLDDCVSFVTGISTEELVQEYARAQIAVCPSLYEGFGLPAGEAMSCGKAVVSTNGGALPEVVGGAGIIVPSGDSEALVGAISALFEDSGQIQDLGHQARSRIEQTFSWSRVAQALTQYYYDALEHSALPRSTNNCERC